MQKSPLTDFLKKLKQKSGYLTKDVLKRPFYTMKDVEDRILLDQRAWKIIDIIMCTEERTLNVERLVRQYENVGDFNLLAMGRIARHPYTVVSWACTVRRDNRYIRINFRDTLDRTRTCYVIDSIMPDGSTNTGVTQEMIERLVRAAAWQAIWKWGWKYTMSLCSAEEPPVSSPTSLKPTRDIIAIGASTALITDSGACKIFSCSAKEWSEFLDRIGAPTITLPSGHRAISTWVLELCILKALLPHLTIFQITNLLKSAQTVYGAATEYRVRERLEDMMRSLMPVRSLLQEKSKKKRSPREPSYSQT